MTGHRPQGVKFYCPLRGAKAVNYFWHNARNNIPPDGFLVMESDLDETTDEGIRLMGEAIKEFDAPSSRTSKPSSRPTSGTGLGSSSPRFRRSTTPGTGWESRMSPTSGTPSATSPGRQPRPNFTMDELLAYYPGDDYVDWFGSHFFPRAGRPSTAWSGWPGRGGSPSP